MSGIAANLRAQNPNWTKDELISMLKRDVYKPNPGKMKALDRATQTYYDSEVKYDANGWNERFGYGVVQP